jgi:hypothetical protein
MPKGAPRFDGAADFRELTATMIERYGFYEGKGTSFRVGPRHIVEVLDFIKGKKKD